MSVDFRTDSVLALKTPAAVAKQHRVLLAKGGSLRGIFVDPLPALGETIRGQRGVGLDLVVEGDAGLDRFGFDRGIGFRFGGENRAYGDGQK